MSALALSTRINPATVGLAILRKRELRLFEKSMITDKETKNGIARLASAITQFTALPRQLATIDRAAKARARISIAPRYRRSGEGLPSSVALKSWRRALSRDAELQQTPGEDQTVPKREDAAAPQHVQSFI